MYLSIYLSLSLYIYRSSRIATDGVGSICSSAHYRNEATNRTSKIIYNKHTNTSHSNKHKYVAVPT